MKKIGVFFVVASFMYLLSGMAVAADSAIPDLTGTWQTKSYGHHHEKDGFLTHAEPAGQWVIKEQKNRFFHGERTYVKKHDKKKYIETFSGVISKDGKRLYIVDHDEDFLFGDVLSATSIELILMNDGDKNPKDRAVRLIEIEKIKQ
jgi:hypothetical protein